MKKRKFWEKQPVPKIKTLDSETHGPLEDKKKKELL